MATFAEGDRVDWAEGALEHYAHVGSGPFIVRGVEDAEQKSEHRQWVALRKKVDGQLFCWASYRGEHGEWIPDHEGPPYIASPPVFSNTALERVV